MKKATLVISVTATFLAAIIGGFYLYIVNTPEYALKSMAADVSSSGMKGLEPYLTGQAKETLMVVSAVKESDVFNKIMGFFDEKDYVNALETEIKEIQWELIDVQKSKENVTAELSFNYLDKLIGTIDILMIREGGEWKIESVGFPEFAEVNW